MVGVPFLDLAEAFDSLHHQVLLDKLRLLGFKASSVTWFESLLSSRLQTTTVSTIMSESMKVEYGVSQGSIP